jgi:hypothetical protein
MATRDFVIFMFGHRFSRAITAKADGELEVSDFSWQSYF